ncbi:hypothetical protein, partial [Ralstonia sp. 3PA37C10]|uniref:hypothetical protein n=1 Tax=Ralstonia sp. 3PA37C10 TaxID=2502217 RepID=UPI001BB2760C
MDDPQVGLQLRLRSFHVRSHTGLGFLGGCLRCLDDHGQAFEDRQRLLQDLANQGRATLARGLAKTLQGRIDSGRER